MTTRSTRWLRKLGPGVITGAADDDPSGIATYSQAGAQFGFALGWTVVLTLPLMIAIQMISARIGRVTGHGLASNIRRHYPAPVLYAVVALLFVANTINVAADIAAMAESVHLVAGGPTQLYAVAFGAVCLGLEVFMSYRKYVRYLKWLTLALFAYVGVVLSVDVQWSQVLAGIALPRVDLSAPALTLESAVSDEATAVTSFDANGQGIVSLEVDGQVVQILATLRPDDRALGTGRVRAGQRVRIDDVDAAKNRCTVSII